MAGRHESERAAWLLEHEASWHMSDRRMADGLRRRAARTAQKESGSTGTIHHQARIKPIISRFLSRSDEGGEAIWRLLAVLITAPIFLVVVGPALLISQAAYAGYSTAMLKAGRRPLGWPWLALAAALAAASVFDVQWGSLVRVEVIPYFNVHVADDQIGGAYLWMQGVLASLLTGWHVRRHGWPGVRVGRTSARPSAEMLAATEATSEYVPAVPEPVSVPMADEDPLELPEIPESEDEELAALEAAFEPDEMDDEDDLEPESVFVETDSPEKALLVEQGINEKNWMMGEIFAHIDKDKEQTNA